jgi:hypothetical protein
MTPTRHRRTALRACTAGALALTATLAAPALALGAVAGPQVVVTGADGTAVTAAPDGPTAVQVSGTGFQSVAGGFGGVYVLFGWVDEAAGDGWRPSAGGESGTQYRYAVDTQGQQNAGYQRFVAFPGSATSAEANGGEVAEDGSWATDLTIPGATLTALGADGGTVEVDCRQVRCGVITIGAHGVANANNESFTPVAFAGGDGAAAAPTAEPVPTADAVVTAQPAEATPTPVAAEAEVSSVNPAVIWVPLTITMVLASGTAAFVAARRNAAKAHDADAASTTDHQQ